MCRWPVLHMALLMVIICIGSFLRMLLLHFGCYFHGIHTHSHFSSGLYWILGPIWLSPKFYSDFICTKGCFWIKFNMLRKNFVILRVSGQNINSKYCLNASVFSLFSFWFVWLGSNAVFIIIVCTYIPSFLPFSTSCFIISMCYLQSMPPRNHIWLL